MHRSCKLILKDDKKNTVLYTVYGIVTATKYHATKPITITNYLFRQNRTRNITKVILITHTKILTLQRSCQGDCT